MNILQAIQEIDRLVFTTRELSAIMGVSLSSATQSLNRLEEKGVVKRVMRGVWAMASDRRFSPFMLVQYLSAYHRCYVSFVSALHIHGIINQIPQVITVASTSHTRKVKTPAGVYLVHQIEPYFFDGFDWHESGNFLIASPEKAFVDCLYIAGRRGKRYASFPELDFPKGFSFKTARRWAQSVRYPALRKFVLEKLAEVCGG